MKFIFPLFVGLCVFFKFFWFARLNEAMPLGGAIMMSLTAIYVSLLLVFLHNKTILNVILVFVVISFFISILYSFLATTTPEKISISDEHIHRYKIDVIKDANPNLTDKEIDNILNAITLKDFFPMFLDYRSKKNAEINKIGKVKEKAYKIKEAEEKRVAQEKAKKDKEVLENFLNKEK